MSRPTIGTGLLVAVVLALVKVTGSAVATNDFGVRVKCCENNLVLSDDLTKCVESAASELDVIGYRNILEEFDLVTNATHGKYLTCFPDTNGTHDNGNYSSIDFAKLISCVDIVKNGSVARADCSKLTANITIDECDSIMTPLLMYGATMVVFASIVYLIPYILVCLLYIFIPGISRRAYDKAVLSFTITQAILSITVITLGHFMLCHEQLSNTSYSLVGITFMSMTIGGVLWLLVISFDVSSTITRFHWAPSAGAKGRDENHKFRVYLIWVSAGTLIPTAISAVLQFSPLPDDFILKPTFHNLNTLNYRVIVHVVSVPVLVAIASNVLFIYTTVKMINIQKSTSAATENRKKSVKEKYILYLKLYLLMDAPYITGALGSIFKDLWILKFCRMLQPVLMLYAVLPREIVMKAFSCKKKAKSNHQANPKIGKNAEPI